MLLYADDKLMSVVIVVASRSGRCDQVPPFARTFLRYYLFVGLIALYKFVRIIRKLSRKLSKCS